MSTILLFFLKAKNCEFKFKTGAFEISMIQIMAWPIFKISGFRCTVNFDFASLYLWCSVDDFQMLGMVI